MKHVFFDDINFIINKDNTNNLYIIENKEEIKEIKEIKVNEENRKSLSLDDFDVPPVVDIIDVNVRNRKKEKEKIIKSSIDLHNNPLYPDIQAALLDRFCGFGPEKCVHFENCHLLKKIMENIEYNLTKEGIILSTQIRFCPYKKEKVNV